MATYLVLTPGTNVDIIPNLGCDNSTGVIVGVCLEKCCDQTTGEFCEVYEVQYDFKACTNCRRVVSKYCRSELVELP